VPNGRERGVRRQLDRLRSGAEIARALKDIVILSAILVAMLFPGTLGRWAEAWRGLDERTTLGSIEERFQRAEALLTETGSAVAGTKAIMQQLRGRIERQNCLIARLLDQDPAAEARAQARPALALVDPALLPPLPPELPLQPSEGDPSGARSMTTHSIDCQDHSSKTGP
jgi:hypothetical protein